MATMSEDAFDVGHAPTFASLQSAFNLGRRARPPPIDISAEHPPKTQVPLREIQLQKRASRAGLRGMFTRTKSEKPEEKSGLVLNSAVTRESIPTSVFLEEPSRDPEESRLHHSMSIQRAIAPAESRISSPRMPPESGSRTLRMNLRSKSTKQSKNTNISSKPVKPLPKPMSKPPSRSSAAWDPPPLFQAFPQAIKHAQLSALTLSADSLLRMNSHRRTNSIREEFAQTPPDEEAERGGVIKLSEKAKSAHRRELSAPAAKSEWTQKIFVLVTSGYLLQYAGSGSFDRLPEKMLQLGKDSVAFASDVIPGKHWVLQVSQAMDANGTPAADTRSLLSRLSFRSADYRRTAASLLLVLESAVEMDLWIAAFRREIEALGGKKHVSETGRSRPDERIMQLTAQPSHRYLVQKNSAHVPNSTSLRSESLRVPLLATESDSQRPPSREESASHLVSSYVPSRAPSNSHHSEAMSTSSYGERQLETLRNSENRFSFMSSGQRTLLTSQGSSPPTTPTQELFEDLPPPKYSVEDVRPPPNAAVISERRRSMASYSSFFEDSERQAKKQRHSIYGPSPSDHCSVLNFSVPSSSSKRYPPVRSSGSENIPPLASNAPVRPKNTSQRRSQKPPLTSIPSTGSQTPSKSTDPLILDLALLPKALPTSDAALAPVDSNESGGVLHDSAITDPATGEEAAPHLNFQFPRKAASMQLLRDENFTPLSHDFPKMPRHPPPALPTEGKALPEIPRQEQENASPMDDTDDAKLLPRLLSTSPSHGTKASKFGRPTSFSSSAPSLANLSSSNLGHSIADEAQPQPLVTFPAMHRLKQSDPKVLNNRRSMPMLLNSSPPAPPPNRALPPIPPPNAERKSLRPPVKA